MPTYEYRCSEGHETERFVRKISDATSEIECPVCGKKAIRQVSGGAGLVFKGSGFYLTDYGKNAHRRSGSEAKSGEKSGESSSAGGTESGGAAEKKGDSGSGASKTEAKPAEKPAAKPPESKPSSGKKSDA